MQRTVGTENAVIATGLIHSIVRHENARAPLLLIVHGRAGTHDLMWTFARGITEYSILAPQAPVPDEGINFSWWPVPGDAAPSALDIERGAVALLEFITKATEFYSLAPRTIIALGFSQGAALLSIVFQREPALFSAVGLLAGFVIENPAFSDIAGAKPEIFVAHGSDDPVVPLARAEWGVDFLKASGCTVEFEVEPVGHKIGARSMRLLGEWLKRHGQTKFSYVGGQPPENLA